MSSVRYPAVAGMFYPRTAEQLRSTIDDYLEQAPPAATMAPKAMIVPHAGYIYSGAVAASAFAALQPGRRSIRRVVLLGPAHRVHIRGIAASSATFFSTPLGKLPLAVETVRETTHLSFVQYRDDVHLEEHSLEVQLPFLQRTLEHFELLPYAVGQAQPTEVAQLLEEVWGGTETLIVISSDLSHYLDYFNAQKTDRRTSHAIERLAAAEICADQACGAIPIRGLLTLGARLGLLEKTVDLRNSGDTAGARDRVVGYGAYLFYAQNAERPTAH